MPSIPSNSAGRLRIFTYSSDIPPALTDPVSINMSLYNPRNLLVYSGDTPIRLAQGVYEFSIPAYALIEKASYGTPYNAVSIITFPDGTTESQAESITTS